MDLVKCFSYRNQNVRFVFYFIRKRNLCVGIGSAHKGLGVSFVEDRKVIIKGSSFNHEKDDFQKHCNFRGNFSGNALVKIPAKSPASQIKTSEDLLIF